MNYQYYDEGQSYGVPQHSSGEQPHSRNMLPSQNRRAPQPQPIGRGSSERQRGPPPQRPMRPGQQQPQQYSQPMPPPVPPAGNLYDGSAYGEPEYADQNDAWPLPKAPQRAPMDQEYSNSRIPSPNNGQRRPPQRPQRPDAHPPAIEPLRQARVAPAQQQYRSEPSPPQPSHHGTGQWTGEGYSSPSSAPQQSQYQQGAYGQANKRPPLGPPPSARRGPASYYAQPAPVMPIAEETDSMRGSTRNGSTMGGHDSMRSYASSNAIPIGIPDYYLQQHGSVPSLPGNGRYDIQDEHQESPIEREADHTIVDDRSSYDSDRGITPEPALVRQASMGRKSKPTLTTVKSGEKIRRPSGEGLGSLPSQQKNSRPDVDALDKELGFTKETGGRLTYDANTDTYGPPRQTRSDNLDKELEAGGVAAAAAALYKNNSNAKSKENLSQRSRSSEILASGTGLIDPSDSSESEKSQRAKQPKSKGGFLGRPTQARNTSRGPSPLVNEVDVRRSQIMAGLEKGGAINPLDEKESEMLRTPGKGLSSKAGKRRPPRLDVDAVRDAEARGSLTSLPDLIVRATKLASNLDRGRTASRLGMDWLGGEKSSERERRLAEENKRRSGSISDMLAAFPAAGPNGTPPGSRGGDGLGGRRLTNWSSSNLRHEQLGSDSDAGGHGVEGRKRGRRCCGMPLWVFLLLMLLLILLAAAAVIVPVVLIVIPRQANAASTSTAGSKALAQCQKKLTCQNGGVNVLTGSDAATCSCICVNGYTGTTCGTASGAGCTTAFVGSMQNTTLGDAIPRLLTAADRKYSIPLNAQALVGLFNQAGLSCAGENALISFADGDGGSSKVKRASGTIAEKRQDGSATTTSSAAAGTATSNGIVFESGATPTTTGSDNASPTSSSSASATSSPSSTSTNSKQDFARIAILYVFQTSGQLSQAVTAQNNLANYFDGSSSTTSTGNSTSVALGNGVTCDLQGQKIVFGNGTTVGGQ
ncbi:hypothetical protein LTR86_007587 [Recurvomyces mirabilis]|nr:hypothetical protein LTR86_007587 [Recurvomyces mirabilis]